MNLQDAINNQTDSTKTVLKKGATAHVTIDDVILVYNADDHEVDFSKIKTLQDVLKLSESKPNVLLHINPPLFSAYKSKTKGIETYVNIGDKVIYRNPSFSPIKENPVLTVSKLEIKSLKSMSVIIASFEEGDFALANHLKKV